MYAIIETGGKQYKVTKGDVIKVEKLNGNVGDKITLDKVLFVSGDSIVSGMPYIENATVSSTIISQGRDKKVIVYKFKRKIGYHKKNGHRQYFTKLKIDDIKL